jgi:hypothetical protein
MLNGAFLCVTCSAMLCLDLPRQNLEVAQKSPMATHAAAVDMTAAGGTPRDGLKFSFASDVFS